MAGNRFGDFRPSDYVVQVSAARQYMENWHYGATLKFIQSNYGQYRSSGVAMDLGVSYADTASLLQASLVVKNMGTQLTAYTGTGKGDLPFDLQVGISKRLAKAPVQFSLTAHHLHQFDISYHDTAFNNDNGFDLNQKDSKFTFDKLFRHIVLGVQVYITDKIELRYARSHYQNNTAWNQFGLSLRLKDYFGHGKGGSQ